MGCSKYKLELASVELGQTVEDCVVTMGPRKESKTTSSDTENSVSFDVTIQNHKMLLFCK